MIISGNKIRTEERGNVLFLILIAVALFAALSYAVTQSSRSGGGDTSGETALINSAQLTQYPASIRTSIIRMIVSGTSVDELNFNTPADFATLLSTRVGVFHPEGGGAVYSPAPPDLMASGAQGVWHFNANLELPNIGTAGAGGNDLIAYLPGITYTVCRKLNQELGITGVPELDADRSAQYAPVAASDMIITGAETSVNFPSVDQPDISDGGATLDGQPYGCFENDDGTTGDGPYVYYHVLVER